ncbi:MAG: phosphate acetyltransferase [Candidatus Omnitrophica bacterium]|nr:phosphate acetyltransferase [Candidatus Omnitrophota bacterium]MCM8768378.1 phosphate acetyltransferase [Candidatus Omnitrophota bacterium]
MNLVEQLRQQAKEKPKRLVLPEGTDHRILQAATRLAEEKIAQPVVLGRLGEIEAAARSIGISLKKIEVIDPAAAPDLGELVAAYRQKRQNVKDSVAERLVKKEMIYGGMMVATGKAAAMVAGAASTTASVIQAASLTIGYQEGLSTPSSYFIMVLPDSRILFYADCAVNIDPDSRALAEIGLATARSYQKLMGKKPLTAFLSFSTRGSASHPLVDKVVQAVSLAKEMAPELAFDGEFQADTALSAKVAAKKLKEPSLVAGQANVLIFPDLNAGNIAYKLTQYLAKAEALGPILQGFARPVSDLSRGASVDDIITVAAVTCLQTD